MGIKWSTVFCTPYICQDMCGIAWLCFMAGLVESALYSPRQSHASSTCAKSHINKDCFVICDLNVPLRRA